MVRLSKNIRLLEKKDRLLDRFFRERERKKICSYLTMWSLNVAEGFFEEMVYIREENIQVRNCFEYFKGKKLG